jgi:hypothetical protein
MIQCENDVAVDTGLLFTGITGILVYLRESVRLCSWFCRPAQRMF